MLQKTVKNLLAAGLAVSLAGCGSSVDQEAVKAPVEGYLAALHEGDFEKAATYEVSGTAGSDDILSVIDGLESSLEAMAMGDAFNEQAWAFMEAMVSAAVDSYSVASVEKDGSDYKVTADVEGISGSDVDFEAMMMEAEDDLAEEIMAYAEENAGETDAEKLYGDLGKIIFTKMIDMVKELPSSTYQMTFTVTESDGSYLISGIN